MSTPVVFIDRDGTLIEERGYLQDPEQVTLIEGAAESLRRLSGVGYAIVVLSNQSGVARGMFPLAAVEKVNHRVRELLAAEGASLAGMYCCPHPPQAHDSPYGGLCVCRKPYTGMAREAASVLDLALSDAFVVGDKVDDMGLANRLNAPGVLVRTGYGRESEFNQGRPGAPVPPSSSPASSPRPTGYSRVVDAAPIDRSRQLDGWVVARHGLVLVLSLDPS